MRLRRWPILPVVAVLALMGTACDSKSSSTAGNGVKSVDVKLTDAGCDPANITVEAGPTTFKATNAGTSKVSEFYVMSGTKIEGEVENVVAGITKTLSLNLSPGSYGLRCPGGSSDANGVLTVSGTSTTIAADTVGAVANYKSYVQKQADELVTRTQAFTDAVIAGDVTKAKSLYAPSRAPYERIEPVAESFGDLDPEIDARADDTPVDQIMGFHRIEHALWENNSTADMTPVAQKLLADVTTLRSKIESLDIDAAKIANGANELLGEVSKSKVTGEEERYSHTDLWDFDANVAGSKAAIDAVRPLLDKVDPALGKTIDDRYSAVETDLAKYKKGDGWAPYDTLTKDDTLTLSRDIDALAEPVSQVAAKVVGTTK